MKIRRITLIILAASFQLSFCTCQQEIKDHIKAFKDWPEGRKFLENHSEEELEKMIQFINNPLKYFREIENTGEAWCSYFDAYARFLIKTGRSEEWLEGYWFEENFQTIEGGRLSLLTFLLSNSGSCGLLGELLADRYTKLFEDHPRDFINDLKERENWKQIVNYLDAGSARAFRAGLAKLGDSDFEKEFKAYVFAPRDKKGRRIVK